MKKSKRHISPDEKAITLIALVVTIVILLILAGVTITMTLGQNGLFIKAQAGRKEYEQAEVREDLSMLITQYTWDKASEKTDKSLGDYLKDNGATSVNVNADGTTLEVTYKGYTFKVNKDSGKITGVSKGDNNDNPVTPTIKPKVGEIVSYTPDTVENYNLSAEKSGDSNVQTIDNMYDPTTWKVMEVDKNGNITKLFGVPNGKQSMINFYGSVGYNNGVYLLNDICAKRYKNTSLGATAKHLAIEDIELKMNEDGITARNSYGSIKYGTTKKYLGDYMQYPAVYAQEKYSGINVSDVTDGTQVVTGTVDSAAQEKMNPNGKMQSDNVYSLLPTTSETIGEKVTNLTCTQLYYGFGETTPSSYFSDMDFYSMIFGTGTYFWIASRYTNCDSSDASWGLRFISSKKLYGLYMFDSEGYKELINGRLAPVVTFDSAVQIKNGTGTTEDPYIIGK